MSQNARDWLISIVLALAIVPIYMFDQIIAPGGVDPLVLAAHVAAWLVGIRLILWLIHIIRRNNADAFGSEMSQPVQSLPAANDAQRLANSRRMVLALVFAIMLIAGMAGAMLFFIQP